MHKYCSLWFKLWIIQKGLKNVIKNKKLNNLSYKKGEQSNNKIYFVVEGSVLQIFQSYKVYLQIKM